MTSARIFHTLIITVMAAGVATTVFPSLRGLVATLGVVAGVLLVLVPVAKFVADEIRWNREIDQVIKAPVPSRGHDLVAR